MKLSYTHPRQDVTIRLDRKTLKAHVISTWPGWTLRFLKYWGDPDRVEVDQEGALTLAEWTVHVSLVNLHAPSKALRAIHAERGGSPEASGERKL